MARWLKQNESIGRATMRMLIAMGSTLADYQQQHMPRMSIKPPKKATPELTKDEIQARIDRAQVKRQRRMERNIRMMQS